MTKGDLLEEALCYTEIDKKPKEVNKTLNQVLLTVYSRIKNHFIVTAKRIYSQITYNQ